jgi:hypothetical protein
MRLTENYIVKRYTDYRRTINARGDQQSGPADVYFSISWFEKEAKYYGWGENARPDQVVEHRGDNVTLFEVLEDVLKPDRVVYL